MTEETALAGSSRPHYANKKADPSGAGLFYLVAGAGFRPPRFALRLLLPLIAMQCIAAGEPASSQVQNLLIAKQKRAPLRGTLFCLVAGARYENYMQIEIGPFPLVA